MKKIKIKNKDYQIDKELTIGEILKYCRIQNDIKIKDVSLALKIKEQDIKDLENDGIYLKKSVFYINGLIKIYGNLLKIDRSLVKEKVASLAINVGRVDQYKLIDPEESEQYIPGRRYVAYAILLLLIIYFMLFCDFNSDKILTTDSIIDRIDN